MNEVAPRRLLPRLIHGSECKGHAELRVSHTSREVFHLTLLVCANEKFRTNPFSSQPRLRSQSLRVQVSQRERTRRNVQQNAPSAHTFASGYFAKWERDGLGKTPTRDDFQQLRQRGLSRREPGFQLRDPGARFNFHWLPLALYVVLKSSDRSRDLLAGGGKCGRRFAGRALASVRHGLILSAAA